MRVLKNVLTYSLSAAIIVAVAWMTVWAVHNMWGKISTWEVPSWDFSQTAREGDHEKN